MRTVTMPAPFKGTVAEANRNFDTHNWGHSDEEIVCYNCEAKPWHVAASYPCGQEPARINVDIPDGEDAGGPGWVVKHWAHS